MPIKLLIAGVAGFMAIRNGHQQSSAAPLPPLVTSSSGAMALEPAPIKAEWIIRGTPVARLADHSHSDDGGAMTAVWDCTAGEFRWFFGWDETVVIQEGEVHVTAEDGSQRLLRAGDIAYFRGGTWAVWRVDNYVRKIAFLRRPLPLPLAIARKLRSAIRPAKQPGLVA